MLVKGYEEAWEGWCASKQPSAGLLGLETTKERIVMKRGDEPSPLLPSRVFPLLAASLPAAFCLTFGVNQEPLQVQSCTSPPKFCVSLWPGAAPVNCGCQTAAFSFVFAFQVIGAMPVKAPQNGDWVIAFAGLHKYLYTQDEPVDGIDPLGQDMWVAQGHTLAGFHQTFNVGVTNGIYRIFQFGVPGSYWGYPLTIFGLQGFYRSTTNTGPSKILFEYGYLSSTLTQDREAVDELMPFMGSRDSYGLCSWQCRDFAQACLKHFAERYPLEFTPGDPVTGSLKQKYSPPNVRGTGFIFYHYPIPYEYQSSWDPDDVGDF